jgi:4-aminobutyrate aminotransferase/(S)-3-amino-2-methylpropionate transaminase
MTAYIGTQPDRRKIEELYDAHILKQVIHPIVVERAVGVSVLDTSGKSYLDFTAGFGVNILGHNNDYSQSVRAAMIEQIARLTHAPHYLYYSEPVAALAEKLAALAPGRLTKTFFCNSGTEAVEGAIRLTRKSSGRYELLALQRGFMGRTMGAVSLTGSSADKKGIGPLLPGVHHLPAPYCYRCSLRQRYPGCNIACADYAGEYLQYGAAGSPAGFFFEPMLGDAGVITPPAPYFAKMRKLCQERDILMVADETLTCFGKTGRFFAVEHWELEPDILVLGKALGGGLPLGAFVVTSEIAEHFEYSDFSSTMGGNPVACAAGLATIEVLEREDLVCKAGELGRYLSGELAKVASQSGAIGEIRGKGLLIGIEIVEPESGNPAPSEAARIRDALRESGILVTVYGPSTLRISPPLVIERTHLDHFVDALRIALSH